MRIAEFHKQPAAAGGTLRQAAAAQPPSYRALMALAQFYLSSERVNLVAAEAAARQALLLDRGRVEGYSGLGEVCVDRSDWGALDSIFLQDADKEVPDQKQ